MTEPKEKVTISIDAALLRRIDAVCARNGESRSAWIELVARKAIDGEEDVTRDMENPLNRALFAAFTSSPSLIKLIAGAVGEQLTPEEVERLQRRAAEVRRLGKERQASKRSK